MPQAGNREIRDKSITESKLSDSIISLLNQGYHIVEATGTNNYIGSNARIKGLTKGTTRLTLFVDRDSTGNCTLNLNQYGVKNIRDSFGNIVTNMKANIPYNLCYNGTDFILQGKGGGGNVQPHEVLNGKTYTSDKGPGVGTMPNNGSINGSLNAGQSKVIPKGYIDGGTITANSLASQTQATAGAGDILSGKDAIVNGNRITGNIPNRGEAVAAGGFGEGNDYYALTRIPYGYYPPSSNGWAPEVRISKDSLRNALGITADKIVNGQQIAGVPGNVSVQSLGGRRFATGELDSITLPAWVGTSGTHNFSTHRIPLDFKPSVFFWINQYGAMYYDTVYGSDNIIYKTRNEVQAIHYNWGNELVWENDSASSWTISGKWAAYE